MARLERLKRRFIERFGGTEHDIRCFFAPGRVNLIGEHIDYSGGYVFPAALTFGTTMLIRKRSGDTIRFASENFPLQKEIRLAEAVYAEEDDWINYPKAVLVHLAKRGHSFGGYDVLYSGDIPNGAGLSSSASIQLATAFGFLTMEGRPVDRVDLALVAQESENEFLGVKCGIMDQFTVAMGRPGSALLLKCSTLAYEHVPFAGEGHKIVIGNTNKRRGLVDSEYNLRREQCEQAVGLLKRAFPQLTALCELTPEQLAAHEHLLDDPAVRKRAKHAVEENERVLQSVDALKRGDLRQFGRLMVDSHRSLQHLYEVSCRELDVLVEEALSIDGVLGARMTGAGFGGCIVALVKDDAVDKLIAEAGSAYKRQTGRDAAFYVAEIGGGVTEI